MALPILPLQILWINMVTAVLLGLTLAFEPKGPGIMLRPLRDPTTPILTGYLIWGIILFEEMGTTEGASSLMKNTATFPAG